MEIGWLIKRKKAPRNNTIALPRDEYRIIHIEFSMDGSRQRLGSEYPRSIVFDHNDKLITIKRTRIGE